MNGWNSVPDSNFQLYEALLLGQSGLSTPFQPKNLERLRG